MENNLLPKQIQKFRMEHTQSQAELAKKLYVSRQAVSKWEGGLSEPSIDKIILLTKIFSVTLEQLILGSGGDETTILKLNKISKSFDKPVLENIDLHIHSNERVALLGNNGAGKSTLIKIISGEIQSDDGQLNLQFSRQDELEVMAQENVLVPTLKVKEQVKLTALIKQMYSEQRCNNLLKEFKLLDSQNTYVSDLSGGQRRRLALLLSIIRPAKLLILDEPTVGMDLDSVDMFWRLLEKVNGTVLMVTHDFNQIDKFFSRVLILNQGKIIQDALVKNIHSHNQTIEQWYRNYNREEVKA